MKESIEKVIRKRRREEKSVIEKLREFKEKEEDSIKKDSLHPKDWGHIEPDDLIQENQELFDLFDKQEFKVAQVKALEARGKIDKIKDREKKDSNERFIHWIAPKIPDEIARKELKEEKEKDN